LIFLSLNICLEIVGRDIVLRWWLSDVYLRWFGVWCI
jgi:hypothetical protein